MDCCFVWLLGVCLTGYFLLKWILGSLKIDMQSERCVFVTGCNTGFGNLLVKRLDSLGIQVFAGCLPEKGQEELRKATSERVTIIDLDVTKAESIQKAYQCVKETLPPGKGLWGLVNNAGIVGNVSHTEWQTSDDYRRPMEVNFLGMTEVTRTFLPLLRRSKGRIVNMVSFVGRFPTVHSAPYVASKFAAEGYSAVLRRDLKKCGISVHIISPGTFNTGIVSSAMSKNFLQASFDRLDLERKDFYGEDYLARCIALFECFVADKLQSKDLHKVTDAYTHALTAKYPKIRYTVGMDANLLCFLLTLFPEWLLDTIMTVMLPTPRGAKSVVK